MHFLKDVSVSKVKKKFFLNKHHILSNKNNKNTN